MSFKTLSDAQTSLPADVKLSCTFGYPGEGGFTAFYRRDDGARWTIKNGPWNDIAPDRSWTVERVD